MSFVYDNQPSAKFLADWPRTVETKQLDAARTQHIIRWIDPKTGLEVRCEAVEFSDYPGVEWTVYLKNGGTKTTPILNDIQALDTAWSALGDVQLRRSKGSTGSSTEFAYRVDPLSCGETIAMAAGGGRSSNAWLPFFNLQTGKSGVITAIGWSGQWAAEFARDQAGTIRLRAGQELTHLVLHPGEEIRSPRMLMLFWDGEVQESHNLLRRFILAHHVPKAADGQPVMGPVCAATWGGMESAHHLEQIADIRKHKLDYDYYWIDAGWYGPADSFSPDVYTFDWARHVGNWNINPRAHPHGLKPLADAAHAAGLKFLLWFEPERAVTDTPWTVEHPEWYLGERKPGANLLYNLGNPEARRFLTDFISNMIREVGIDCYRQDFNFDPLPYWRAADAPDRQGMAEIRYVEGHYEFWDELLRRHPGLLIDNCASGGRRIDLETISRSIPLWRSDYQCQPGFDPAGSQMQTHGLSYWLPVHGGGTCGGQHDPRRGNTYHVRSNLSASLEFPIYFNQGDSVPDHPWDWQRRMIEEYKRARPFFYGDYYPLTAGTLASDVWLAMQYHRPDLGEGMLLAFRRENCAEAVKTFRLSGLDPTARYEVSNLDLPGSTLVSGRELTEKGLTVEIADQPFERRPGPDGCVDLTLPMECKAFGPFSREDGVPAADVLRRVPSEIALGSTSAVGKPVVFNVDSERLADLEPVLEEKETVAFVYLPFTANETGLATFGFGADWWYEAYLDGELISETLSSGGNKTLLTPTVHDHTTTVAVTNGEHLLVVRFIRGTASAWLAVGGPRDLVDKRVTVPGAAVIVYRRQS